MGDTVGLQWVTPWGYNGWSDMGATMGGLTWGLQWVV